MQEAAFSDIKLREIDTYLELITIGSVRQLARQRNTQAGQISKIISALEHKLNVQLLDRSATGVQATATGSSLIPYLRELRGSMDRIADHLGKNNQSNYLCFATSSFFSTHFLPKLFSKISLQKPQINIRLIDLAPDQLIPVAMRSGFQICVHMGEMDWPKTWTSSPIGELHWVLVARKNHPLDNKPIQSQVLKYPFVYPVYWTREGIRYGNDSFPVPINRRIRGFETATATSAIEVVKYSDQLGFLPKILVQEDLDSKNVKLINFRNLKPVSKSVYLTVKNDSVTQKDYQWFKKLFAKQLIKSI